MRRLALIGTVLVAGLCAAPATAQNADRLAVEVVNDILDDGQVEACDYTSQELQTVLDNLPPDVRQYQADVQSAIRAAIQARARGDCDDDAGTGTAPAATPAPSTGAGGPSPTPAAAGATPVPTKTVIPEPPGPDANLAYAAVTTPPVDDGPLGRAGNDAPTPLLLLGVLAAVALGGVAVAKGGARVGVTEGPLAPVRHAWREAAWRFGGNWETFRDWVRLGR